MNPVSVRISVVNDHDLFNLVYNIAYKRDPYNAITMEIRRYSFWLEYSPLFRVHNFSFVVKRILKK